MIRASTILLGGSDAFPEFATIAPCASTCHGGSFRSTPVRRGRRTGKRKRDDERGGGEQVLVMKSLAAGPRRWAMRFVEAYSGRRGVNPRTVSPGMLPGFVGRCIRRCRPMSILSCK